MKIGLALGSGGLRGIAHLGVLKTLEEEKIPIHCIAGCSIGAMMGALYSAGHDIDMILQLGRMLGKKCCLDFVMPKLGLFAGDHLLETMRVLTQNKTFDALRIPLSIVATELCQGKEIVFSEGNVSEAIRASVSVPGIFVPYQKDGMILVDGALVNPIPIDIAQAMGADIVIAVSLLNEERRCGLNNVFDVIIQSIDIMEREMIRGKINRRKVVNVNPAVAHISPSSFDHMEECFALGKKSMELKLHTLYQLMHEIK